jgi:hypothetical protein
MAMLDSKSTTSSNQIRRIIIFAFVIGVVSAIILAILLVYRETEMMKTWTPIVLTIELGLVIILLLSIAMCFRQEHSRNEALKKLQTGELVVTTCPDYWTASTDAKGNTLCKNVFQHPEDTRYKLTVQGTSKIDGERTINLSSYDGKEVQDVCKRIDTEVMAPWLAVSPICK